MEVDREIDKKLNDVFQIRTGAILSCDKNLKLELIANLLYLYDDSWLLETEGGRIVVGHNINNMQKEPDLFNKPQVQKQLRRWLKLAELGHLVADGTSLVDSKKYGRLITGLMDRLEHKLGLDGVKARVRIVATSQKGRGKENAKSPRLQETRRSSCLGRSPLRSSNAAAEIPPSSSNQLPRTPITSQNHFIPQGKQIPRTPPSSSQENSMVSNFSSEASPSPVTRTRGTHLTKAEMINGLLNIFSCLVVLISLGTVIYQSRIETPCTY